MLAKHWTIEAIMKGKEVPEWPKKLEVDLNG